MSRKRDTPDRDKLDTRIIRAGRRRELTSGGVNPVVQRASTILVDKASELYAPGTRYGIHGTVTHTALSEAMCELEDAAHCQLAPSGLLACTVPILALAGAGGHVLMTDNCYGPTRRFCDRLMKRWGGAVTYFDPRIGAGIADLIRPDTKVIFLESPGSLTFEICDTPAIVAAAKARGVTTVMDNTWSAGVYHKPLALGVDVSVQATSKYAGGAADVLSGAILANDDAIMQRIRDTVADLGLNTSPDDAFLVLRGLRTLTTRLERHQASGLAVATWLAGQPDVAEVLHPALPASPDHAIWSRDFGGATGLFGVVLKPVSLASVEAMLDELEIFGMGFSWGGYESLAIHCDPQIKRTASRSKFAGPLIRLSIGLEDPDDLIADLEAGFEALRK